MCPPFVLRPWLGKRKKKCFTSRNFVMSIELRLKYGAALHGPCLVSSLQCTVHSDQFTVLTSQCTLYTVQCTRYNEQCTLYTVQCTRYNEQCTVSTKDSKDCPVCNVPCQAAASGHSLTGTLSLVLYNLSSVLQPLLSVPPFLYCVHPLSCNLSSVSLLLPPVL